MLRNYGSPHSYGSHGSHTHTHRGAHIFKAVNKHTGVRTDGRTRRRGHTRTRINLTRTKERTVAGARARMPVFICENCNETLRRNKVATHNCGANCWYMSCMDCNKRFGWDNYLTTRTRGRRRKGTRVRCTLQRRTRAIRSSKTGLATSKLNSMPVVLLLRR